MSMPLPSNVPATLARWKRDPTCVQWFYRVLVVLASLAFLHVFPTILFLVYMGSHGFFDYAFFREGPFVLGVFYGTAELLLIASSLVMFGALIPLWGWKRRSDRERLIQAISFGVINCLILAAIGVAAWHSPSADHWDGFVFIGLGLAIAVHLTVVLHESAKRALFSLLGLLALTAFMVVAAPRSMASLLALGLRVYNVGGGIEVSILRGTEPTRHARLIFLGPTHAYLAYGADNAITVLERNAEWELRLPLARRPGALHATHDSL